MLLEQCEYIFVVVLSIQTINFGTCQIQNYAELASFYVLGWISVDFTKEIKLDANYLHNSDC